jgi:hypothetical protein
MTCPQCRAAGRQHTVTRLFVTSTQVQGYQYAKDGTPIDLMTVPGNTGVVTACYRCSNGHSWIVKVCASHD